MSLFILGMLKPLLTAIIDPMSSICSSFASLSRNLSMIQSAISSFFEQIAKKIGFISDALTVIRWAKLVKDALNLSMTFCYWAIKWKLWVKLPEQNSDKISREFSFWRSRIALLIAEFIVCFSMFTPWIEMNVNPYDRFQEFIVTQFEISKLGSSGLLRRIVKNLAFLYQTEEIFELIKLWTSVKFCVLSKQQKFAA